MKTSVQKLALLAVGTALFVVLSLCLQVPVFENYYLCLGYVVMAVYCWCFGPLAGTVVGFFGVILYCVVISGLRGMPGWALGNIPIGLVLGFYAAAARKMRSRPLALALAVPLVIAVCALGILGVKSLTESLLYLQPFLVRVGKNFTAFVADAAVLLLSLPLCWQLERPAKKLFPQLCAKAKE